MLLHELLSLLLHTVVIILVANGKIRQNIETKRWQSERFHISRNSLKFRILFVVACILAAVYLKCCVCQSKTLNRKIKQHSNIYLK